MKLKKFHVKEFRSILDSGEVDVGDITCLVGKNEAGKTGLLQALYKLNPILAAEGKFDVTDDYPRRDVADYRADVDAGDRDPAEIITATFELDDEDVKAVEAVYGKSAIKTKELVLEKGYDNNLTFDIPIDEKAALAHLIDEKQFTPEILQQLKGADTLDAVIAVLAAAEQTASVKELATFLSGVKKNALLRIHIYKTILLPRVPKFFYFDEFYQMDGRANIEALKARMDGNTLVKSDHPLLGLINLARLDLDELINPDRTRELKNSLEGAGNHLSKRVIKYWSQNRYLQLRFDVRPARPQDPEGMRSGTNIWGDVYDTKHLVTTELGTRSRGFVWFFSFLAWYSDIQRSGQKVILLLDEPGLSLHAKAQEDLLKYFEAEVKGNHQLIYSTHSPFMVDPSHFDRVRIVQDLSIETDEDLPREKDGTKVITDVLEATKDSLFPLQGALGYEIYQTLFVGPNSLVVEGVSDLLYLQVMSGILQSKGRVSLDSRWTITPVGGSDKVPTFVSIIGSQKNLNVAVLIDFQKKDQQTIENLYKKKLLQKRNVSTFADFTGTAEADIEDMFDTDFFLEVVNNEYKADLNKPISESDLTDKHPRVLVRLEKFLGKNPMKNGSIGHFRPAKQLSENSGAYGAKVSDAVLEKFEKMFKHVNSLLK